VVKCEEPMWDRITDRLMIGIAVNIDLFYLDFKEVGNEELDSLERMSMILIFG
jgi:hypothetical protein